MTLKTNKIHLFRSTERAEAYSKMLAQSGGCLNHKCTTPTHFVRDLIQTAGFENEIIGDSCRLAHLISVISSTDDLGASDYFYKTQNLDFLIRFIEQTSGSDALVKSLDAVNKNKSQFSFLEESAILVSEEYQNVISAFGLSEFGVAAQMAGNELKNTFYVEYVDECDVPPAIKNCIEMVAVNSSEPTFYACNNAYENKNNKNYSFAVLSETRAKNAVFLDVLKEIKEDQKIAIVTNDVEEDARTLERLSEQLNSRVKIKYRQEMNFLNTSFGQALYACDLALHGDQRSVEIKFSDFMHNPLSGVSLYKCLELEKDLRANPNIARQRVVNELKNISPTFDLFMAITDKPFTVDKTPTIDAIESHIKNGLSLNEALTQENLAALNVFRQIANTLCIVGFDDEFDYEILRYCTIATNCVYESTNTLSEVILLKPTTLNQLSTNQFDKVIFSDASSKMFNASNSYGALSTLLDKMGIYETFSASKTARLNFITGIAASKCDVVFCLPMRELRSNDELTPSFALQELFIEIWGESFDLDDFGEKCRKLKIHKRVYGEEDIPLISNACINETDNSRNVYPLNFQLNECKDVEKYLNKTDNGKVILSPSEIETYCQCPYKWFYERRISPNVLDYEFNQIEKGNIIHLAFKLFYDELYSQGIFRLNDIDDAQCRLELFTECYNKAVRQTLSSQVLDGEEITKVENFLYAFDIMQSLNDCMDCLLTQSMLPKKYIIAESEMRIKPEQHVEYAGVIINGTIDRLDVSPETDSFCVIDYKGNIRDHGCGKDASSLIALKLEDAPLPNKIQALIYATCVQKMTNKKCDAAIYITYNQLRCDEPAIVGAIDVNVINEFSELLRDTKDSIVNIGMDAYLDATEIRIRSRLNDLLNGNVYPCPVTKNTCMFCTAPNCPMRGCV